MASANGWDAIVIGAGVGGCVVAADMAAAGRRVLVLEAGPGEPHPESVLGLDTIAAAEEPSRRWSGLTVRSERDAPARPYRQGFGVGGGSLINSLLLSPGDSHDYRRWQQLGCQAWGPGEMAPFLETAAERFVGTSSLPGPVSRAFDAAAVEAGHPGGGSSLDRDRLGVLETRLAAASGRRVSAVEATGLGKSGAVVRSGCQVRRVVFDRDRVVGVELGDGGLEQAATVVVAAGAIRSPLLLLDSGLTLPGIGRGLRDHPSFAFTLALNRDALEEGSVNSRVGGAATIARLLRWSSTTSEHGDLQAFVIDRVDRPGDGATQRDRVAYAVVVVGLMRVTSTGWVAPLADDPSVPTVVTGALGTVSDRDRFRTGVLHVLDLLRSAQLAPLVEQVLLDEHGTRAAALDEMDPSSIDEFLARHPGPYAHPAGTCAMGSEGNLHSVVSGEPETAGQVIGTRGLYVADASIMPDLVQGGLQLPVAALAARVAHAINVGG